MTGSDSKAELTVEAVVDNLEKVTSFVDERLGMVECPVKVQMKIDIAVDEIFSNIAHYAYCQETGMVTVRVEVLKEPMTACITFIDQGTPYNPLSLPDPDISLSAEERQIGGLGIYMVRRSMDDVSYEYREGKNIFAIKKGIHDTNFS